MNDPAIDIPIDAAAAAWASCRCRLGFSRQHACVCGRNSITRSDRGPASRRCRCWNPRLCGKESACPTHVYTFRTVSRGPATATRRPPSTCGKQPLCSRDEPVANSVPDTQPISHDNHKSAWPRHLASVRTPVRFWWKDLTETSFGLTVGQSTSGELVGVRIQDTPFRPAHAEFIAAITRSRIFTRQASQAIA